MTTPAALLDSLLAARVDPPALEWLRARIASAERSFADAAFLLAFSSAPRRVGRADLAPTARELERATQARRGFRPGLWTVDQAARARLLLALPSPDPAAYVKTLDRLFDDADLGELVALYSALPLLPHPSRHRERAAEGIRSNMKTVFEAVALRNPYPAEELEDPAWNQLVLKCLFVGSPLVEVEGFDSRVNPPLARMLADFAHERWAAGRPVPPELWRGLAPLSEGPLLADVERVLRTGTDVEIAAAALGARNNPRAAALLGAHRSAVDRALAAYATWDAVATARPVT